jgi:hypothetical protein
VSFPYQFGGFEINFYIKSVWFVDDDQNENFRSAEAL